MGTSTSLPAALYRKTVAVMAFVASESFSYSSKSEPSRCRVTSFGMAERDFRPAQRRNGFRSDSLVPSVLFTRRKCGMGRTSEVGKGGF